MNLFTRVSLLVLLLSVLLGGRISPAWASRSLAGGPPRPSLSQALNPDGTLQPGLSGSFEAAGYQVQAGPGARPVFRPRATAGAGDQYWQDGFDVPGASFFVNAVAVHGTDVYIGGEFVMVGNIGASYVARWDGTAWHALRSGVNDIVRAIVVAPNGDVYAGGRFTQAGGSAAAGVARWNGSTWSALGTGLSGVFALALAANGDLYAGGSFTTAGGVTASNLARWDGTAWHALGSGLNSTVYALAVHGTEVYAGGSFSYSGSAYMSNVARWNGRAWRQMSGFTGLEKVNALAVVDSMRVYAGGISRPNGTYTAAEVVHWNGSSWSSIGICRGNSYANRLVSSLSLSSTGELYVGGYFDYMNMQAANNIVKWNGSAWSALGTGLEQGQQLVNGDNVRALAVVPGGEVYAGGSFHLAGGRVAHHVAHWRAGVWHPLSRGLNREVTKLAVGPLGDVYVGGPFTQAGSLTVDGLAVWDGGAWRPVGAGLNARAVSAIAIAPNGDVYVAGPYKTRVAGLADVTISKWDGATWTLLGAGMNGAINALVVAPNGDLYAGGGFTRADGTAANRVARWDGTAWSALGATGAVLGRGVNNDVNALALAPTGELYVGGIFTIANGQPANRIAKWDGTAWSAIGAATANGLNNTVNSLAVAANGTVFVGGNFTTAGGLAAANIARWDGTAWSAMGAGMNTAVYALAIGPAGTVYAGGGFRSAGGGPASYLARWDGSNWAVSGTGLNGIVTALAVAPNGDLVTGGSFSGTGDNSTVSNYLGIYNDTPQLALRGMSPGSGPVGTTVQLLGRNFTGVTTVTFNGTAAAFTVHSDSRITATVPAGATTGLVSVQSPGSTVTSAGSFVVTPLSATTPLAAKPAATLYPNPARTTATLQLPATAQARTVSIFDTQGRLVRRQALPAGASSAVLDVRALPAGAYSVRCGALVTRLVVE